MRKTVILPLPAIIERLPADAPVFVLGCGDCATREQFGGAQQCRELAERLAAAGISVAGWAALAPGEAVCNLTLARRMLTDHANALAHAGVVLLLACPQGEPVVARATDLPVVAGVQAIVGSMTGGGSMTIEDCHLCDECIARAAGGLCPYSFCPKHLLNGPCGGAHGGRCEVFPKRPCVWELIYWRLQAAGALDILRGYRAPVSFRLAPDE
ncbi:MAG: methylenetetrahydrofolate reductase C-terminal domain-containing protein [Armatimonadota bacterium]